jgi:hypothetical protein
MGDHNDRRLVKVLLWLASALGICTIVIGFWASNHVGGLAAVFVLVLFLLAWLV